MIFQFYDAPLLGPPFADKFQKFDGKNGHRVQVFALNFVQSS